MAQNTVCFPRLVSHSRKWHRTLRREYSSQPKFDNQINQMEMKMKKRTAKRCHDYFQHYSNGFRWNCLCAHIWSPAAKFHIIFYFSTFLRMCISSLIGGKDEWKYMKKILKLILRNNFKCALLGHYHWNAQFMKLICANLSFEMNRFVSWLPSCNNKSSYPHPKV